MADNRPDGPDLLRPSDHNVNGNGNGNAPGKRPVVTSQDSNVASFLQQHVADLNEQSRDPAVGVKGSAPNFGQFPVPHVLSFQGLFGTFSRVYRPSDEAVKDSLENARYMRNDAGVMECVEARQRCTALLDWHLQPEDENSPEQIELVDQLTKILNRIERFTEYRYNLLHAVWYGRYAIQHRYRWDRIEGKMRVLPKGVRDNPGWIPVNGDKLVFRYDDGQPGNKPDQVGIRVGSRFQARDRINGRWNVEPTERGLAYFLEDWERGLLALHKHTLEDGSWEVGYEAGTIHGVGLRSRIYWDWFQKQEALAFLMEYLERSAGGIEIWHYPMGNAEAEAKARTAAEERIGNQRNIILVPKPMGDDAHAFGVEIVEPGMAGIDALQTILTDYYGHRIKRYILGQTLSSEAQATGLGSGLADLHLDTFLQIIKYDAVNLEETITHQLVKNIKDWNFPAAKDIHIEFKLDVEGTDTAEKLQAWQTAWQMGAKLKESDVMDLIGASVPTEGDNVLEMPEQGGDMGMEGMGGGGDMFGGPGPNGDPQASGIPTEDFDRRDDGPLPPDRDRDTDSVLAELFGEATAEGQTITYVSSNGKWMQQDMPHNTGERARGDRGVIDRNAKQGMLDFDEGKHPRDEGGKFTSGAGGPVPDGKQRAPIIPEGGKSDDDDAVVDMESLTGEEFNEFQQLWKEENRYESGHGTALAGTGAKGFPSQEETAELMEKHGTSNPMDAWGQESMILASKKWRERKGGKSKNAKPNFDEQEHPRDEDGKFSSTPVGTKRPDTEAAGDYWEKVEDHTDIDESGNPDAGLWKRRKGAQTTRKELGEKRDRLKLRIDDKSRQKAVTSAVNNLLSRMSRNSSRRLNYAASTFHFHEEPERMIGQLSVMAHTEGASPVAAFDADNGTLHLVDSAGKSGKSGATLGKDEMMRQTYAHAMSHAIDGRFRNERLSNRDAWVDAWENDLSSGQLTDHGSRNTREGFAEFGRLVFSSDVPEDRIAELFPNCWKFWKGEDLV